MLLLLLACESAERVRVEPSFIHVTLDPTTATGTAEAPMAFSAEPQTVALSVETFDVSGDPYPFNGTLALSVRPGRLVGQARVTLTEGKWTGETSIEAGFGPTRVWATDEDVTDDRTPSWSAGVSGPMYFQIPSIPEMQATDNHETNQLAGEFAELRVSDRNVVVAAVDPAGFYAADLGAAPGNYAGLYIYTFQKPPDEIVPGAKLSLLTGQNQEYLAATQLSFPTLEVEAGTSLAVPAAVTLTESVACDDNEMEKLEGSRVRLENAVVPASFTLDSVAFAEFEEFGQWPLELGNCALYAESSTTVPDYYPPDHAGETLSYVEGMLKEVYGKWIFVILDAADIGAGTRARKGTP